ncbi:MAG: S8 family serine peptidase [Candidatus Omnitrophota bacterium]
MKALKKNPILIAISILLLFNLVGVSMVRAGEEDTLLVDFKPPSLSLPEEYINAPGIDIGIEANTELQANTFFPELKNPRSDYPQGSYVPGDSTNYYNLDIGIFVAWNMIGTGNGVVVAVIDTGVDYTHQDLESNVWINPGEIPGNDIDDDRNGYIDDVRGWNFFNNNNDTMDTSGPGTHCAGIIAGEENAYGVTGIAPHSRIMALKVREYEGGLGNSPIDKKDIVSAIDYAVHNGANLILIGFNNFYYQDKEVIDSLWRSYDRGIQVVAPAGDENRELMIPTPIPVKFITATTLARAQYAERATFSNYGQTIELSAPGANVYSTYTDNRYMYRSSTVCSAAYYIGVLAIERSNYPGTGAELTQIVRHKAIDMGAPGFDVYFGHGLLSLEKEVFTTATATIKEITKDGTVIGIAKGPDFLYYEIQIGIIEKDNMPVVFMPVTERISTQVTTLSELGTINPLDIPKDKDYIVRLCVYGNKEYGDRVMSTKYKEYKIVAGDGEEEDWFGYDVSISGDYAIVGAHNDNNKDLSGSAYIFKYEGTDWVQEQKLNINYREIGHSVSISEDCIIVGAYYPNLSDLKFGSAYIFRYDGNSWVEEQKLVDDFADTMFGWSVSVSGDCAIIGACQDSDKGFYAGSAYIFRYDGNSWVEEQKLVASDGTVLDKFGLNVSISGDHAIISSGKGTGRACAYIFRYDGNSWVEEQKLTSFNNKELSMFGVTVSISGDCVILGDYADDDKGEYSGSAYIFRYDGNSWVEEQKLVASDGNTNDLFGRKVSISENRAIVSCNHDDDNGEDSGSVYIYHLNRPPTLDPIEDKTIYSNKNLNFTLTASDSDNDPLTFSAENLPEGAVFNPSTQEFSWTPTESQIGDHEVTFKVSDGEYEDSETITIKVLQRPRNTFILQGRVFTNDRRDPLLGVAVWLIYPDGSSRGAGTGPDGWFVFNATPAGTYKMRFGKPGYEEKTIEGVKVIDRNTYAPSVNLENL